MSGRSQKTKMDPYNIVDFGPYHTAMTQPVHAHIRRYWDDLRGGQLMPQRSDIDPREMSPYLEHCFVLQHSAPGDTRFRLAGMALNEVMGMELRGMPLRSIIVPEARGVFSAQLEQTFAVPEIQEYHLVSDQPHAPRLTARLLILPLKGDETLADRAIGCMTTEGTCGIPPRRFRIDQIVRTALPSGKVFRSGRKPTASPETAEREHAGFAETQTPYDTGAPTTTETAVPYLRVVK